MHLEPSALFQNIHKDFLLGNLIIAQQEAESGYKEFVGSNTEWALQFLLLDAEILTFQGRSQDVIALLNGDNASHSTTGDPAIKKQILCGLAHARLGQLQQSNKELQEAQNLSDVTGSSLREEVFQAKGLIERHFNHLDNAKVWFEKSLVLARQSTNQFLEASDLLNLGVVALETEHYDEALDRLKAASEMAWPIQARVILETALGDVGIAYYNLGDFEKALANFRQAAEEARLLGTLSTQVNWLTYIGLSFYRLGDFENAKNYYQKSLEIAETIQDREWIANTHTDLAALFYQLEQDGYAKKHAGEALQAAGLLGDKSVELDPLFLQGLIAARQSNAQEAKRILIQVYGASRAMPSLQWKVENAFANFYVGQHESQLAKVWFQQSIRTFELQRRSVEDEELKLPFFANADALYRDYAEFLIKSHRSDQALQLLDLGRARTLEEGLGLAKSSSQKTAENAQSVARKLNATVLFYSLGPERSYLWAVTPGRTQLFDLPKQADIESSVQAYQKAILKSSDPLGQANEGGRYLYNALVAPAASMIPKGSRVFVIPDGILNNLNFETLLAPDKTGSHYWIEDVTVTNANSIRMLSRFDPRTSTKSTKKLLLIGNPVSPSTQYEALPNASVEVSSIQKHFQPESRTVLTQAEAIPTAYADTKPDQFSYIHFVAHGTASRLSPLDSAVVLSPPAKNPDNFKLYARDIVHQPLHANLVTISACYGSGTRAYAGEGLVGLSWAFLRAGAHNVIGALWEANDASTPQLMDRLYTELDAGQRPDAALRAAKLALIHSDSVYRKPLYWAAFQLYAGS